MAFFFSHKVDVLALSLSLTPTQIKVHSMSVVYLSAFKTIVSKQRCYTDGYEIVGS